MIHTNKPEVKIFEMFELIGTLSKPSDKLEKLKTLYSEYPTLFKEIVHMVYSKEKFNIGERLLDSVTIGTEYRTNFTEFKKLAVKAQKRIITGNELKAELNSFFLKCDPFTAKWYKRILLKDLRIGVGYELIYKLFQEKEDIRSFAKPMKAVLITDISDQQLEKLFNTGRWQLEPKFDGFRCFAVIDESEISLYSYNGKRFPYLEQVLLDDLLKLKSNISKLPITIDGEVASKNWNVSMSFTPNRKNKLSKQDEENIRFYAFDLLPVNPTKISRKSHIVIPLKDRQAKLKELISKSHTKHFVFVEHKLLTKEQLSIRYLSQITNNIVSSGKLFDGIVVKQTQSPYEFDKRSKWWIKVKKFETIDLLCVDIVKSTKRPNEIAAIVVLFKGKRVKVSGFKEDEAKHFYKHPEEIVGKIVEVKFMEITKDGSLRHPTFIRIRDDKNVPDA